MSLRSLPTLALAATLALASGCVNGVRSGMPAAGVAPSPAPARPPQAQAVPPPPPPTSSPPPAVPTVWRAEYYTISDG